MELQCNDPLHVLYEDNCPTCNPDGYRDQLAKAPQAKSEPVPESEPVVTRDVQGGSFHGDGYSDTY